MSAAKMTWVEFVAAVSKSPEEIRKLSGLPRILLPSNSSFEPLNYGRVFSVSGLSISMKLTPLMPI